MALHEDGEDEEDDELHREVNHALAAVLPAEGVEHEADHRGDGGRIFTAASVSHLVLSELITTFVVGSGVILRNCSKIRGGVILSRIFFLQSSGEAI